MCSSSEESSDNDDDAVIATLVINEHITRQRSRCLLYNNYFKYNDPLFPPNLFRRCFRIARHAFNRIRERVVTYDGYFKCKYDTLGKAGFFSYQKCVVAVCMLAHEIHGDLVDEYVRMSESASLASLYKFCKVVVAVFDPEYLREQNTADTTRLLAINESRGFLGMLGSIDCMHQK